MKYEANEWDHQRQKPNFLKIIARDESLVYEFHPQDSREKRLLPQKARQYNNQSPTSRKCWSFFDLEGFSLEEFVPKVFYKMYVEIDQISKQIVFFFMLPIHPVKHRFRMSLHHPYLSGCHFVASGFFKNQSNRKEKNVRQGRFKAWLKAFNRNDSLDLGTLVNVGISVWHANRSILREICNTLDTFYFIRLNSWSNLVRSSVTATIWRLFSYATGLEPWSYVA